MRRARAAALVLLAGLAPGLVMGRPVLADPFDEAVAAHRRGDYAEAWMRFWSLARAGDPAAQFNLAQIYRRGQGIPAEIDIALSWYLAAARQGHALAQYTLGLMYENGDGVARDLDEARAWYRRASAQRLEIARTALERLDQARPAAPVPPPR
ncbi:MAG: tetratricopeptide repeat protein [Pseudomonadota bacterium]